MTHRHTRTEETSKTPSVEIIPFEELQQRARVARMARRIRAGEYQPDLDALASALLDHPDLYTNS